MILTIETALHGIARMLHERVAPAVQDDYVGEAVRLAEMFLALNANWVDDAASVRVAENAAIRTLLVDGAAIVTDARLAGQLITLARFADPGLKISELDEEGNRLRLALQDMHAHIDALGHPAAVAFGQRIWRALADFEAARAPR